MQIGKSKVISLTPLALLLLTSCVTPIKRYQALLPRKMTEEYKKIELMQAQKKLDFGLYFFGEKQNNDKYVVGKKNKYFDPKKPTVIYVHGWERGTTVRNFRETF